MSVKRWKALVAEANSVEPMDELLEVHHEFRAKRIAPLVVAVMGIALLVVPILSIKLLGVIVAVACMGVWVVVMQDMQNRLAVLWMISAIQKQEIAPENKVGEFTQVFGRTDAFKE